MDRFSSAHLGRLDSVAGVGPGQSAKAPSLASFLSQRANQVLGARQSAPAAQVVAVDNGAAAETSSPVDPKLARQMDQLQRLHSSLSVPSGYQGISVVV